MAILVGQSVSVNMPTWISKHKADITFVIGLFAGIALISVGLAMDESSTILLGAGALGIPGFQAAAKA